MLRPKNPNAKLCRPSQPTEEGELITSAGTYQDIPTSKKNAGSSGKSHGYPWFIITESHGFHKFFS